jgi:hypothetical protein
MLVKAAATTEDGTAAAAATTESGNCKNGMKYHSFKE